MATLEDAAAIAGAPRARTDPPLLAVVVLSDDQATPAWATATSVAALADRVVVLERGAGTPTLPPWVELRRVDWGSDDRSTSEALAGLPEPWVLVLGAGETVDLTALDAVRHELRMLAPGPVEVALPGGHEVRLHPTTPGAIAAIGAASGVRAQRLRIVRLPEAPEGVAGLPADAPPGAPDVDPVLAEIERERERLAAFEERRLLDVVRGGRDVCWVEGDDEEPLVTVRIPTYNRGPLIVERALRSAMNQTYERIEILVVGDHCDEATERAVRSVDDPRIRFVNLPARGIYPADPWHRWMVAGCAPVNAALDLAQGAWIAPCDDDDELTEDHVEVLLAEAKRQRVEFIHSKARMEAAPGHWIELGSSPLRHGQVSHGTVMYSLGLRFFRYSNTSWKMNEPADWNMWRRMRDAGVKVGFLDRVTYTHYVEAHSRADGSA